MPEPKYFQGQTVTGQVRASPARNFREVVDALRLPPTLPLTRSAYFALPERQRSEAKKVPYFVAACFDQSPSPRTFEHATHCNLIFLDIDPEKELQNGKWVETGRYPAAPFAADPERLRAALEGFNFAAHLTASSTPDKPRMRVIVSADGISLEDYPRAVETVARMLGLPSVTRESRVAVQAMFAPSLFLDSADEDNPLLIYELEQKDFQAYHVTENFYPASNGNGKGLHAASSHGADGLDFLRAPVPEVLLSTTKEALGHLDPDCSREEWLECAAALKHQFSHKCDELAYDAFDEWSQGGKKYGGDDETRRLWDSLRPTPHGRLPVTIRSLLRRATEAGWNDKQVKRDTFNALVRWMEEEEDFSALLEQSVPRIIATPCLSNSMEGLLLSKLSEQAKKRFAHTVSVTSIRKDMEAARKKLKEQQVQPAPSKEPQWAKGLCYLMNPDHFFRQRTGEKLTRLALNAAYARHLLPTAAALQASGLEPTPANLAKPIVPADAYALNFLKIPTAYDYAYDPAQPGEMFFVANGRRYVNTYVPTYPEADAKHAARAAALLTGHLRNLIQEPELRTTLLDFMAYMVQFPGRKIRWAVVIQGAEGCGKTFLAELMKSVLGREHVKTIDGAAIKGNWNEWAFGHQLVVLEEVRVAGTNRHEVMNALKPLITNDDISMNERFRNNRDVENISNYMLFSNHHDALAITGNDRRYFIIKSPLQTKSQVLALGQNYFPPLFNLLRDNPGAVRAALLQHEISTTFNPDGHAPQTRYASEMAQDSSSEVTAAVRQHIREADHSLLQYDVLSSKVLMDFLKLEDGLTRCTMQHLGAVLREEGYQQVGRHLFGEERHYLWAKTGVSETEAIALATARLKSGAKNLGAEIYFS